MTTYYIYDELDEYLKTVEADVQPQNSTTVVPDLSDRTNKYVVWTGAKWIYPPRQQPPDGLIGFVPAPVSVPLSVSMRQARLALLQAGFLSQVDAAINGIADETQRKAAQIEWEYAADVKRGSPLVQAISSSMGLTNQQLDELFRTAASL